MSTQDSAERSLVPLMNGDGAPEQVELRLYIAGQSARSRRALENLKRILEKHCPSQVRLQVIDIYQQREKAREDNVIGAPTLVRQWPLPLRRVIGDLSNEDRVLLGLELPAQELEEESGPQ